MQKTLHILNGDSTLTLFNECGKIAGDTLVWREMLCDGKSDYEVGSEDFFKKRVAFFKEEMAVPENTYLEKTKDHFDQFNLKDYHEIVLWFEYDLFCQINLIAAISYILQNHFAGILSRVNLEQYQSNGFTGLGELESEMYGTLYSKREEIKVEDATLADDLWKSFCSDQKDMSAISAQMANFPFMKEMTDLHFQRFPSEKTGLNTLELQILRFISDHNPTGKELVRHLLSTTRNYGFGDQQLVNIIKSMNDLYIIKSDRYEITESGLEILHGRNKFSGTTYPGKIGGRVKNTSLH